MNYIFTLFLLLLLNVSSGLFAVEYALGLYPNGFYPNVPGIVEPPGTLSIRQDAYNLHGHLKGAGVRVSASYYLLSGYYTTHYKILGGDYAVGALIPIGRISVHAPKTTTYSTLETVPNAAGVPQPAVVLKSKTHSKHQVAHGVGDIFIAPFRLGWQYETLYTQFLQSVVVPTGSYNKKRIANMGFHRWATDTVLGFTWLPHTRTELSLWSGILVNFTNHKTHYRSGSEWHNDFMVAQYLTDKFKVGVAGYWYYQLTPDSGKGATFGNFRGRLLGIGPEVSYDFMAWGIPMQIRSHYYKDVYAKNHIKGHSFYLTLYMSIPSSLTGFSL